MYDALTVDVKDSYAGKPNKPIKLESAVSETSYSNSYPRYKSLKFQWQVEEPVDTWKDVEADNKGRAEYTWSKEPPEGKIFHATLIVNLTTEEGIELSGGDTTEIHLKAGLPTAHPGGPYRGGIYGGNFSPVQLEGDAPGSNQGEDIGEIVEWKWTFKKGDEELETSEVWKPTQAFEKVGEYKASLKVKSEFGKWSKEETTKITVIDGKILGVVKAADLRTPVKDVKLTLTSSHVDKDVLDGIANEDGTLLTAGKGVITTTTNLKGEYAFEHLPLGSYRIVASKVENKIEHEFRENKIATELTLDSPDQLAIDFVDITVYPVGGRIVYDTQLSKGPILVEDVKVIAQPVGGEGEAVEAVPSTKSPDALGQNYHLPLFAGKYLFLAKREGHDIRIKEETPDYDKDTQLTLIERGRTDIDFIDKTKRKITVYVEDSGGYPIKTYQGNPIEVQVGNATDGYLSGTVKEEVEITLYEETVPPGKYTVKLPNVPTAIVKGEKSDKPKREAEVDVTGGDGQVTMVVPVKIELEITSDPPKLIDLPDDVLEELGIKSEDNPEGYMFYFPPDIQKHEYKIKATANGKPVEDFTLKVRDDISQLDPEPASEKTYTNPTTDDAGNVVYTIYAGLPKSTKVDESDPDSYTEDSDGNKLPKVEPKEITFEASKDSYENSDPLTEKVIVLGEVAEGGAMQIVSIPNVNYFVLHDPPGDASYSYLEDSMTIKGVISDMTMKLENGSAFIPPRLIGTIPLKRSILSALRWIPSLTRRRLIDSCF